MGWKEMVSVFAPIVGGTTAGFLSQGENAHARNQADQEMAANIKMQREFAKNGIRWRVEDAKAAGLHPLAALGASSMGYSPVTSISEPDHSRSDMVRDLGQNISRATMVMATPEEKAYRSLQVESLAIDNALKKKELEGTRGPGLPSNSGLAAHLLGQNPLDYNFQGSRVLENPTVKSHAASGKPFEAAGEYTDYVFSRTATGLHPVPSKENQEAIEDKFVPETLFALRNYLYPNFSQGTRNAMRPSLKDHPLPPGYTWQWVPWAAEFRPRRRSRILLQEDIEKRGL